MYISFIVWCTAVHGYIHGLGYKHHCRWDYDSWNWRLVN